ncbi:MAG TPA: DUF6527 family protein [Streptosporangiaceae bacterium]|nr:DUF6527 family protein [Streptosporangiaceae bacterium]HVB44674.1 DUF6527 family protein [Streptosporangiaceae bacterium]
MRHTTLIHEFVEYVPTQFAEGILYISIPHRTAVHLCACGCGNKVVTPITPADWQLFYDGDTVSLTPSIGNWGFPCRSHYWIDASQIRWSPKWTNDQIAAAGRAKDGSVRAQYFAERRVGARNAVRPEESPAERLPWFRHLRRPLATLRTRRQSKEDKRRADG